jgi:threonine/homoserine/homoserine lactone efflux protein
MHVGPFLAVAAIVVITPGVDMALVTRNALMYGRRAAVRTALGINLGIFFWVMAASLGLAAVVATSAEAFAVIKLAGALYLVYLGVQALRSARHHRGVNVTVRPAPSGREALRQGLVSNLLNPKIAVFFTSLLPQFVGTNGSPGEVLLLGLLFNAMGVCWLLGYAIAAARWAEFPRSPTRKARSRSGDGHRLDRAGHTPCAGETLGGINHPPPTAA